MRITIVLCAIALAACASHEKGEVYEIGVESCLGMLENESHPYWKSKLAVNSCEMLLMVLEEERLTN